MSNKTQSAYDQYIKVTYAGKALLEKHSLDETGLWEIRGEDANCDWGGSHHMPRLGFITGTLKDVIKHAVKLPSFWTWGGGGSIEKVVSQDINDLKEVDELLDKKLELEAQLKKIDKALGVKS